MKTYRKPIGFHMFFIGFEGVQKVAKFMKKAPKVAKFMF